MLNPLGNWSRDTPFLYPGSTAPEVLPQYGRTGPKASTLIPEIVLRGATSANIDAPLLINTSSALIIYPQGEARIPFSQSTARGELREYPLGSKTLAFEQLASSGRLLVNVGFPSTLSAKIVGSTLKITGSTIGISGTVNTKIVGSTLKITGSTIGISGTVNVTSTPAAPTSTFAAFTMVRAVLSTAETVHYTGTAAQTYKIELIHLGNTAASGKAVSVYITAGVAGTVATRIVPGTTIASKTSLELSGPFILKSTSQIRASTATTNVIQFEVTGGRIV